MNITLGSQPTEKPPGTLRAVHFPQLALLDEGTKEGWLSRVLHADGGGVQELPRSIFGQFVDAPGHSGAVPVGALHEVTFNFEAAPKLLGPAKGFLADDENGRRQALSIMNSSLRHNSVDLGEVTVEIEVIWNADMSDYDIVAHFTHWKLAKTTFVSTPAFPDARGELTDDEVMAALTEIMASSAWDADAPLIVDCPSIVAFDLKRPHIEITAGASPKPSRDYFFIAEPAEPTPLTVEDADAHGFYPVYGHLAQWDQCHVGILGECIIPPRPPDNYASWNTNGVLTDNGKVYTGPLCLRGGHHPMAEVGSKAAMAKAYLQLADNIDNAWADVRVTEGVIGPWLSGYVRPGTSDRDIIAARASGVSGHWLGEKLAFAVSVNARGYPIDGPVELEIAAAMTGFTLDGDGAVVELFAGLPPCADIPAPSVTEAAVEQFVIQGTVVFENVDPEVFALLMGDDADVAAAELELDDDDEIPVG